MFSRFVFLWWLLQSPVIGLTQNFSSISTAWADDFSEWNLFQGEGAEPVGQIRLRWQLKRDWSEWEFRVGEEIGTIKMVWKDRPDEWEVKGYGKSITIRTRWPGNPNEWTVSDGQRRIIIRSQYANDANVWYTPDEEYGYIELYTVWKNDPRDWYIIDELNEDVSIEMKLGLIFIPVFHSFPRN